MLYQLLLYRKVTQSYTCIYTYTHTHIYILLFLYYLPRYSSLRLDIVPVLYNRTSLLIHSKCNSLLLLTSNSQSVPFPLGNHKSVSLGVCYSFVDRFILCHFLRGEGLPMELLGQRSDLSCSWDLCLSCTNAGSFNPLCWAKDWTCILPIPLRHSGNSCAVFQILRLNEIGYLSSSFFLISLGMRISCSIRVATNGITSFIFMAE